MTFRVGERVVCVDADGGDGHWDRGEAPRQGAVYTIRRVFRDFANEPVCDLFELKRSPRAIAEYSHLGPIGYGVCRFRPLIERKTDSGVAILKKIARDVTERKTVKIGERA